MVGRYVLLFLSVDLYLASRLIVR
jgi:ornithine--oxo-acid transaminase